jgi:transcriptional regulator with XRE-family HTH domain
VIGQSVQLSSGVAGLDDALGGLLVGDNLVWAHSAGAEPTVDAFQDAFAASTISSGRTLIWVTGAMPPGQVQARYGGGSLAVVDGRPDGPNAHPDALAAAVIDAARRHPAAGIVIDALGPMAASRGAAAAAAMFEQTCPYLFDLGPVACWRAPRGVLRRPAMERIACVTQCVLSVLASRVRIDKADGRSRSVIGSVLHVTIRDDGSVQATVAPSAAGVVAAALSRLETTRELTQAEVAAHAGITPAAVSQAELGTRSLSLDTILQLCASLDITLDEFFSAGPGPGYTIGRRDLTAPVDGLVSLLDDVDLPTTVDLVRLAPGERSGPPQPNDRGQLVLVGSGLVKVRVGDSTPVLRAGDALAAPAGVFVDGWENLGTSPAGFFWVCRSTPS